MWQNEMLYEQFLKYKISNRAGNIQSLTSMITSLLTIGIISVGAMQVVNGTLTLGALIGANILSARALMPAVRFIAISEQLTKAKQALKNLKDFSRLPTEEKSEAGLNEYKGQLTVKDAAIVFPGLPSPLFESLAFTIKPGDVLAVVGPNGSGKTTLARMLTGLIEPNRGQLLVDGVAVSQLSMEWWRSQIVYLPQEPMLFNGTIRENIQLNNPECEDALLNKVIRLADLKTFLDTSPKGLDTLITQNGQTLSLGIRRRIALARGLVKQGQVVVFDEPTEGLDIEGQNAVYSLLNNFVKEQKTIVLFSHDRNLLKGANWIIDLSQKPIPKIFSTATRKAA